LPIANAASALDTTNSIDYFVYSSGAGSGQVLGYVGSNNDYRAVAVRYMPSSQHNICNVHVAVERNSGAMVSNSIGMKVYNYNGAASTASTTPTGIGTLLATSPDSYQVTPTASFEDLNYSLSPCLTVRGNYYYTFVFTLAQTATTSSQQWIFEGNASNSSTAKSTNTHPSKLFTMFDWYVGGTYNQTVIGNPDGSYSGNEEYASVVMNGVENFSNFTASTTLSYSSSNCTPPTNILDVGGGVSYALCYMFVPNQALIDQFGTLPAYIGTRAPFVYATQVENVFNNVTETNASSSLPILDIPLSHYASSTVTGVIPDIIISTSTIGTYFTDSIRIPLRLLLVAGLWISALFYLFYRIFPLLRT